ncbi:hypothetical protein D3C71_2094050 [compost metagenome]
MYSSYFFVKMYSYIGIITEVDVLHAYYFLQKKGIAKQMVYHSAAAFRLVLEIAHQETYFSKIKNKDLRRQFLNEMPEAIFAVGR